MFGPLYVAMVRAGETGGVLEECLLRTADQLEKDAALRRQVRAAMVYPTVVITFAVIVLLALVAFLIPVFEGVFKQFPGKLPALSQFMVDFSHLLTKRWYILFVVVSRSVSGFVYVQALGVGAAALGRVQAPDPDEDRRGRAEGRDRPLVAHVLVAVLRRRARSSRRSRSPARPPATPWSSARWAR